MVCDSIKAAILTAEPRVTITGLANKIGLSYDQLNNIANGRTRPSDSIVAKIRHELKLPDTWPFETKRSDGARPGEITSVAGTPLVGIKVVGRLAAGSSGLWNVDVERRKVFVPERLARLGGLGWIVDGDSMAPLLREGDVAVFKERRVPRNGFVFMLRMPDGSDRVKVMVHDRGDWHLVSLNRKYPPELVPEGAEIVGIMVGYHSVVGARERMELEVDGLRVDPDGNPWSAYFA